MQFVGSVLAAFRAVEHDPQGEAGGTIHEAMVDTGWYKKDITGTARTTFSGADKITPTLRHNVKLIPIVRCLWVGHRWHIVSEFQCPVAQHQSGKPTRLVRCNLSRSQRDQYGDIDLAHEGPVGLGLMEPRAS